MILADNTIQRSYLLRAILRSYTSCNNIDKRGEESLAARHEREHKRAAATQYLPKKKSDLSGYGQHDLDTIALKLNGRPRKTLAYRIPAATLAQTVVLTN